MEQKNWTHVRQLFGYERFGSQKLVELMNDLYRNQLSLMNNYFLPNTKLKEKQRIESKILKKHDKPATPYQRLMNSAHITAEKKEELKLIYESITPFELKKEINEKVDVIFSIIGQLKSMSVL